MEAALFVLAGICSAGAFWFGVRFVANLFSLYAEGTRLNPNKWWDGIFIGWRAQRTLLVDEKYRATWRKLTVSVLLFAMCAFGAIISAEMTMRPQPGTCSVGDSEWETSIAHRFECAIKRLKHSMGNARQ